MTIFDKAVKLLKRYEPDDDFYIYNPDYWGNMVKRSLQIMKEQIGLKDGNNIPQMYEKHGGKMQVFESRQRREPSLLVLFGKNDKEAERLIDTSGREQNPTAEWMPNGLSRRFFLPNDAEIFSPSSAGRSDCEGLYCVVASLHNALGGAISPKSIEKELNKVSLYQRGKEIDPITYGTPNSVFAHYLDYQGFEFLHNIGRGGLRPVQRIEKMEREGKANSIILNRDLGDSKHTYAYEKGHPIEAIRGSTYHENRDPLNFIAYNPRPGRAFDYFRPYDEMKDVKDIEDTVRMLEERVGR